MAETSAADKAFEAALKAIAKAVKAKATELRLDAEPFRALDRIPPELRDIAGLTLLDLDNTAITDLSPLQGMTTLQSLSLDQTAITDLCPLQGMTALQELSLNHTAVSDLSPLLGMIGLRMLELTRTAVTDLSPLGGMAELQSLNLNQTAVSDLSPLHGSTKLNSLYLISTAVSDLSPVQGLTALTRLYLDKTKVTDLSPLQGLSNLRTLHCGYTSIDNLAPLRDLVDLQHLQFNKTAASDLTPLRGMTNLRFLSLSDTFVSDIVALEGLTDLRTLRIPRTNVGDLRPISHLPLLGSEAYSELSFYGTPAAYSAPQLRRMASSGYHRKRTRETLAYLKTLPPWPAPLPWMVKFKDNLPITVETILTAQTPLGWRFSPTHGAMVVYVQEQSLTAFQSQLADMVKYRARELVAKLAGANNGLRSDVRDEAHRFADILSDDARSLSQRSLELWGSLVALGSQLDANDMGRMQGRNALDMLAVDQRSALMTLLQIAGNLVRSFPDVKALDDGAGGFLRREVSLDMVAAMIEAALRAAYVAPNSAALMQHVAGIGKSEGGQAEKATSVSVRGILNLITSATLIAGRATGILAVTAVLGGAAGVGEHVGSNVADHYDLDQAAVTFIEKVRAQIDAFSDNLPPDEAAQLRAAVRDMEDRLADPNYGPQ